MFIEQRRGLARKILDCLVQRLHARTQLLVPRDELLVLLRRRVVLFFEPPQLATDLGTQMRGA